MKKDATVKIGEDERESLSLLVAKYLESNGFSKSFKKFLKEAKVLKEDLNDGSINLEQMFAKYLEACNCAVKYLGNQKPEDGQIDTLAKCKGDGKKSKKGADENENQVVAKQSEASSEHASSEKSKEVAEDTVPSSAAKSKSKDRKKRNKNSDSIGNIVDSAKDSVDVVMGEDNLDDKAKKSTLRNKKKSASESAEDTTNQENKKSKKRKGSDLEENDSKCGKTVESKRKKTEEVEKSEGGEASEKSASPGSDDHSGKQLNGEDDQGGLDASMKTPSKDLTPLENGSSGKEQKSASQKSLKKQPDNSSEPKTTAKAFSRVKIEEVKFADERLQDNSYWAKDGAEIGYGAKAQEVLGQVRGRDFRHEKTKKKRGSYRGGHIDQESHSIKFNYSDEEE